MRVYIPNFKGTDQTLLRYAVRSWVRYFFDAELWIVGEVPTFDFKAEGVTSVFETENETACQILQRAARVSELDQLLVWSEPSIILCNKITPAHLFIPKRLNPHTPFMSCPQVFGRKELLKLLEGLSPDKSFDDIVHEYHAHYLYDIAGLTADWRTDNITLPLMSRTPDVHRARSMAASKMFIYVGRGVDRTWVRKFLSAYFPDKQADSESDEVG